MELGYAATNLGNLRLNGGHDSGSAETFYRQATYWFARAAALQPGNPRPLNEEANAFAWLADAYSARGLMQAARDARRRQYDIVNSVSRAEPKNQETIFRLTTAERALAIAEMRIGERERARQFLFSAFRRADTLVATDPRNAEWLLLRAFIQCDLLFTGLGHPPGVAAADLSRSVLSTAATMKSQGNPREAELGRCLAAIR
jgi:tetratricopeptide (TPR) repeat protein